jgi:succinate dehydrogenase / fumarate reductase cytochrome b subunit
LREHHRARDERARRAVALAGVTTRSGNVNRLKLFLSSTLGQKVIVAVSGVGLVAFIAVHLTGNLLMYAGGEAYNHYAEALHANVLIPFVEVGLLACFLVHIGFSLALKARSRAARPERYAGLATKQGEPWYAPSKTMVVTGLLVLAFALLHVWDVRVPRLLGWDTGSEIEHTFHVLRNGISGPVYLIGSLLLGYHVSHGFQSAFQSLGVKFPTYATPIERVGLVLGLIVAVGFASFPVYAFLTR